MAEMPDEILVFGFAGYLCCKLFYRLILHFEQPFPSG
jgi:hypothetical protein